MGILKALLTPPAGSKLLFSNRNLFYLFLPLVCEQLLVVLAGFTDSIMAAAIGQAAVSGISLIDNIMLLIILIFVALATGGSVIMGQYLGRGDRGRAREAGRQLVWMVGLISLVFMGLFFLCRPFILYKLYGSSSPEVLASADTYLQVIGLSIPMLALFQAGSVIFRTAGNTKFPMTIVFFADILNIVGNYVAIYILGWGVFGTALATTLSRLFSAVIVLVVGQRARFSLRIPPLHKVKLEWDLIHRMLLVGVPFSVENGLFQLGKVMVMSIVTMFGTNAITANAVGIVFTNLQVLPGIAMNLGMTTVVARCLGAGDVEQSRYYTHKIMALITLTNLSLTILTFLCWPLILSIYNFPKETMDMVWQIMFWHGMLQIFIWPEAFSLPVTFRAAGDAKFTMMAGVIIMMLVRVAGAYVLAIPLGFGMFGTWLGMFLDWVFRVIVYVPRYRSRKYLNHKLI